MALDNNRAQHRRTRRFRKLQADRASSLIKLRYLLSNQVLLSYKGELYLNIITQKPRYERNFREGLDNANEGGRFRGVGSKKSAFILWRFPPCFLFFLDFPVELCYFLLYEEKKKMDKIDRHSHHKNNYLVLFCFKSSSTKRAVVNARDEKNALRIGLNKLCRLYPNEIITRVRIGGVFDNTKKRVEKRIVLD